MHAARSGPHVPRPRKPYVQKETTRHGKTTWYFRKGDGPRIRLHGDYESPEWLADYHAALGGEAPRVKTRASSGSLGWLVERYQDSVAFSTLAPGTRKMRASILKRVKADPDVASWPLGKIARKHIAAGRDKRSATPAAAANFVKTVKVMFAWAVDAGHMKANPADGLSTREPKTEGRHTWTVDEVRRYWSVHPIGTQARLAMDIMLFTGMRISDASVFGRQHVKDGWVHYVSKKTKVVVDLPLLDPLALSIEAAAPRDQLTFLVSDKGEPWASEASLGNRFRDWCIAAKVPGRSHGLRKAGATIAGENGASDLHLMAMWGWTDRDQVSIYTARANRKRLAQDAATYLVIRDGT